jgi:hypothetical protein
MRATIVILSPRGSPNSNKHPLTSSSCNEPFGLRPEPGIQLVASNPLLPPGEVPEGQTDARLQAICACAPAHSQARGNRAFLEPIRHSATGI